MTVPNRATRSRRSGRRPGWLLLTVLLVLAIVASSALVFTNRAELLKLAVILALWAAVVAAFVSVIYRRQSDMDQAKVRDLKLVYDLQLDREISARREYELTVETELRRELAADLRAQAADEVASLRAELAALRAGLEILFDADLGHRPAIETDRTTVHAFSDWARAADTTGRVSSSRIDSRIDTEDRSAADPRTEESPIIDVPAEPHAPEHEWTPSPAFGGAHRRASEADPHARRRPTGDRVPEASPSWSQPAPSPAPPAPPLQPEPVARSESEPHYPWLPPSQPRPGPRQPEPVPAGRQTESSDWQPAPADGQWIPAGAPGSNWVPAGSENGSTAAEYVGRRRAPEPTPVYSPAPPAPVHSPAPPAMSTPPNDPPRGRHSAGQTANDPGRPVSSPPPTLATAAERSAPAPPAPEPAPKTPPESAPPPRHRSVENTGGQSVADLLARLRTSGTEGGGRRRRAE